MKMVFKKYKEFFLGYVAPSIPLIAAETFAILKPLIAYNNCPEQFSNLTQPQPELSIIFGAAILFPIIGSFTAFLYGDNNHRENYRKIRDSEFIDWHLSDLERKLKT